MSKAEAADPSPSQDDVRNKYSIASNIVKKILKLVVDKCVAGAKIQEICTFGDKGIMDETGQHFVSKKDIKTGLAFPTTLSVNNIICHYSPVDGDVDGPLELKDGDLVKIDMGAHIDGFCVVVGHSHVVGASPQNPVTGRKADVIHAANKALEAALRKLKPGCKNMEITDVINKVTSEYNCNAIRGIQSHETKQHEYDTEKTIVLNPTEEQRKKVESCTIEPWEVWILDVVVSTGDGKAREHSSRPNLYKKNDTAYQLKLNAARQVYAEANTKFSTFPFHVRYMSDIGKFRMAMTECSQHGNIEPMQVFEEKEGEFVAQFKSTILVTDTGPIRLSGSFDPAPYKTELKIKDEALKELLLQSLKIKKEN
ncbi:Proliferation-associated protein 2G4 [Cichlidogyrus casuarinus]|uniref:Proliferation-associated protein 2G4 n=1 Tax=Cichlidogyrus casuarinus TaxID=1844966 RepID=A0ABD2QGF5_9PLAT